MDRSLRRIVGAPRHKKAKLAGTPQQDESSSLSDKIKASSYDALPCSEVLLEWVTRLERKPHSVTTAGQLMRLSEYQLMNILGIGFSEAQVCTLLCHLVGFVKLSF
jgi:hypothetical protein